MLQSAAVKVRPKPLPVCTGKRSKSINQESVDNCLYVFPNSRQMKQHTVAAQEEGFITYIELGEINTELKVTVTIDHQMDRT